MLLTCELCLIFFLLSLADFAAYLKSTIPKNQISSRDERGILKSVKKTFFENEATVQVSEIYYLINILIKIFVF